MKQGWEIKKLGEVCEIVGGSTPKTGEPSYWDGEHYWVTPAELDGAKYVSSTSRTITDKGVKSAHLQLLPSGTVLLSSRAPIGKVAITTAPMYCNQGFKNLVCSTKLRNEFAYWFLYHHTEYLNSLGTGATFKEISKRVVEQIPIPVPPIEEQERIVAELDCLSGIIERKREQLRELDALAQSIFYQMFGDPITNEKGWDVKKWEEVFDTRTGKLNANVMNENGKYPFFTCSKDIFYIDTYAFDCEALLLAGNNATANYDVKYYKGKFNAYQRTYVLTLKDNSLYKFFKFALENKLSLLQEQSIGGMTKYLTLGILHQIEFIVPPFALQQEFAERIDRIEQQRKLISQSIKEVEDLFNSRMAYYFN